MLAGDGQSLLDMLTKPKSGGGDPSSALGAMLGIGSGPAAIPGMMSQTGDDEPPPLIGKPSRLAIDAAPSINYAQQNADDAMMRGWLDYEGIAILADAGMSRDTHAHQLRCFLS